MVLHSLQGCMGWPDEQRATVRIVPLGHGDDFCMGEADDICDLVERGHFDFNRPHDEVVADLLKVARLCMVLRDGLMEMEREKCKPLKWWPW